MRGRAYEIVVFRDRPEVRRLVEELLGDRFSASATAGFVDAGIWPVGAADPAYRPDALAAAERDLLARAIAAGSFRVDATDLLPEPVERRFARAILAFLERGAFGLRQELREIEAAWPAGSMTWSGLSDRWRRAVRPLIGSRARSGGARRRDGPGRANGRGAR